MNEAISLRFIFKSSILYRHLPLPVNLSKALWKFYALPGILLRPFHQIWSYLFIQISKLDGIALRKKKSLKKLSSDWDVMTEIWDFLFDFPVAFFLHFARNENFGRKENISLYFVFNNLYSGSFRTLPIIFDGAFLRN